eukprot:916971-Amphidinium_carterae.1
MQDRRKPQNVALEDYIPAPSGYGGAGFQDGNIMPVAPKDLQKLRAVRAEEEQQLALQSAWQTDTSTMRNEVRDVFERYVGNRRKLPLHELTFLSINIAAEVGLDAWRYPDWPETVADKFQLVDFTGEGALDREGTAVVMEKVMEHYSNRFRGRDDLDEPSIERLRQEIPYKELFHEYEVKKWETLPSQTRGPPMNCLLYTSPSPRDRG